MTVAAILSNDGRYRYTLTRQWSDRAPMVWCMLNPSTADASKDDPTIRRCIGFAVREGWGGIHVVNLMAFRTKDPAECVLVSDPIGWENDGYLEKAAELTGKVVCAWGTKAPEKYVRRAVALLAGDCGRASLWCLGTTRNGSPRHPLYVRSCEPLREWKVPA